MKKFVRIGWLDRKEKIQVGQKTSSLTSSMTDFIFTSWYDVSHAMEYRVWGKNSIKKSLTLLDN